MHEVGKIDFDSNFELNDLMRINRLCTYLSHAYRRVIFYLFFEIRFIFLFYSFCIWLEWSSSKPTKEKNCHTLNLLSHSTQRRRWTLWEIIFYSLSNFVVWATRLLKKFRWIGTILLIHSGSGNLPDVNIITISVFFFSFFFRKCCTH